MSTVSLTLDTQELAHHYEQVSAAHQFKAGQIEIHTQTTYTGTTATDRVRLYFDDDFKIDTSGIPKCDPTSISGTITMSQAIAQCGQAKIGDGTAKAAAGPNTVNACVLAFNGTPSGGWGRYERSTGC